MSSSLPILADVSFVAVAVGIVILAAYKAFTSRKIMAESSYRNWATWTGFFAALGIPYEVNLALAELGVSFSNPAGSVYVIAVALAGAFVGVVLVDGIIRVTQGLDYFHRDVLLWRRGGWIPTWITFVIVLTVYWVFNITYLLFVALAVFLYPITVLIISITRAHESVMLDYIKWFGAVIVMAIVATTFEMFTGYNFLQVIFAFFLYRQAGSLSGGTYHQSVVRYFEAPRDYVYRVYTDPSMLTKITSSYKSASVRGKTAEGGDIVEVISEILGMKVIGTLVRNYTPPSGMEEEFISAFGNGGTRFTFLDEDGGTRIVVSVDIDPKGALAKLFGGFGARRARSQIEKDFNTGKIFCETTKPSLGTELKSHSRT